MVTDALTDDDCLCQGKVPKDRQMDVIQYVTETDQKGREKSRWKPVLRFHMDCPHHGVKVIDDASRP
jgi:hypothetical protein